MSQLRNLLRGISHALLKPPARVLASLNEAMTALRVDVFATVVLAQIDPDNTVVWSNAGHPPPVLMGPDGAVHLLDPQAEPLLGIRRRRRGSDHSVRLAPGASIVLYTDGLIERRAGSLDDGLTELLTSLAAVGQQELTAEQLCDHLLATFAGATEDDVVLCVVQAH
jgi:serine phosphatase RsbU (regulator of sigma subunit)